MTDRDTQYFLAEASCGVPEPSKRQIFEQDEDLLFAGREAVPKKGTICEVGLSEMATEAVTNLHIDHNTTAAYFVRHVPVLYCPRPVERFAVCRNGYRQRASVFQVLCWYVEEN